MSRVVAESHRSPRHGDLASDGDGIEHLERVAVVLDRKDVVDGCVEGHGALWVKSIGDGVR